MQPPLAKPAARGDAVVAYPIAVSAAPLSFDVKALLAMGLACGALHLAQAGIFVAQFVTQRNVSWFSGFWGWYYVVGAVFRTILPSLLVIGLVGVWTQKRFAVRWTVWSALALIVLGLVELAASLVSFFTGPPRSRDLGGVMLSIGLTFLSHYALLLLLIYALKRPASLLQAESAV